MKFSATVARPLAVSLLMAFAGAAAAQQAYPSKPIRFIVPYPPGGTTSPLARLVGQKLTESWGQQVLVDNRPGGQTMIGTEAVAKSAPDGYTIMLALNTHVIVPLLNPAPFDAIKDFAPIATVCGTEQLLVVHPSVPANNLREFIALGKARPGQLNYASGGNGTVTHLTAELFSIMAGIKIQHIPYKGGGPALADLLGGQVQLHFQTPIIAIPNIRSGRLKAIAVSGESRLSTLPQVPTFTEAGLPGLDAKLWFGVLAPAATPKEIIGKLSTEIAKILAMADIKEKLHSQGMDPLISTPEQFAALVKAEMAKWARVIKTANIKADQ